MKILNDEQLAYLKSLESPKKRRKFMLDCLVKNVLGESVKSVKISDLPKTKVNDEIIVFHLNNTVPKTFENLLNDDRFMSPSDVIQRSVDLGLKGFRAINEAYETADKLKNDESAKKETQRIEEEKPSIETKVEKHQFENMPKGYEHCFYKVKVPMDKFGSKEVYDAVDEYLKNNQSAKSNYTPEEVDMAKNLMTEREKFAENVKKIDEKKWTDEDMRRCFFKGLSIFCEKSQVSQQDFYNYLKSLKNE